MKANKLLFIIYQGTNIKSTHSTNFLHGFLHLAFDYVMGPSLHLSHQHAFAHLINK